MRDAFGGAFSIKLMLIFLMLYISFICVALNYARAFRVKNRIINIIEQNEGYCGSNVSKIDDEVNQYLNNAGYYINYTSVSNVVGEGGKYGCLNDFNAPNNISRGYCIYRKDNNQSTSCGDRVVYSVETYMMFDIPIISTFTGLNFPITIKGETKPIERIN